MIQETAGTSRKLYPDDQRAIPYTTPGNDAQPRALASSLVVPIGNCRRLAEEVLMARSRRRGNQGMRTGRRGPDGAVGPLAQSDPGQVRLRRTRPSRSGSGSHLGGGISPDCWPARAIPCPELLARQACIAVFSSNVDDGAG